jgi:hypothetical protein
MSVIHTHLDEPIDRAEATLIEIAGEQGWVLEEGPKVEHSLEFKKGVTAVSWGSTISVKLEEVEVNETKLVFTTHEFVALTDWGRGRRNVNLLLLGLGAEKDADDSSGEK